MKVLNLEVIDKDEERRKDPCRSWFQYMYPLITAAGTTHLDNTHLTPLPHHFLNRSAYRKFSRTLIQLFICSKCAVERQNFRCSFSARDVVSSSLGRVACHNIYFRSASNKTNYSTPLRPISVSEKLSKLSETFESFCSIRHEDRVPNCSGARGRRWLINHLDKKQFP